jgi:hypothetical protein
MDREPSRSGHERETAIQPPERSNALRAGDVSRSGGSAEIVSSELVRRFPHVWFRISADTQGGLALLESETDWAT